MTRSNHFSRRQMLQGIGLGAALIGANHLSGLQASGTHAQSTESLLPTIGFFRFTLGNFHITAIPDGSRTFDLSTFSANTQQDAVEDFLTASRQSIPVPSTFNVLLLEAEERKILIDTGFGRLPNDPDANIGKLITTLPLLGISPDEITDVILTHFHPDHIGGVSFEGVSAYQNARIYFPQGEFEFLQGSAPIQQLALFFNLAQAKLEPLVQNDQLTIYNPEDEIVAGIQAIAAPGHTPGHVALLINSEGQTLLHLVDSVVHHIMHFSNPEWVMTFDLDPQQTIETRKNLLARAADEELQVIGYHMPFPGVGYVVRKGSAFEYIPAII
ncbi:MAG: MBL fold metallo-hydrolase [Chloroflexota bacterium]